MRRLWWAVIALFIVLAVPAPAVRAVGEGLEVKFKLGFENAYKIGNYAPCYIEVANSGSDIKGEVQVEIQSKIYNEGIKIFSVEANIPKGSTKGFTIKVPIEHNLSTVTVRLLNGKRTVYEKAETVSMGYSAENNYRFIGILSDDFDSVNYFNYDDKSSKTFRFDEGNFPEDELLLDSVDAIVINNFDTAKLSEAQYTALKKWVEKGGLLVLGTGPSHAKTLGIFKDGFISWEARGLSGVKTRALSTLVGKPEAAMSINILDINLKNKTLSLGEGQPLFQGVSTGQGMVFIASMDLGLQPVSDWQYRGELASRIINDWGEAGTGQAGNTRGGKSGYDPNSLESALRANIDIKMPKVSTYAYIFLAYILLVGPVSYLVMKKLDKRELLWFTIPAISLVFTLAIYFEGFSTRIKNPLASVIHIVNVGSKGDINVESLAGVMTPRKADLRIESSGEAKISPIVKFFPGDMGNMNNNFLYYKYTESQRPYLEFYNAGAFDVRTFRIDGVKVKDKMGIETTIYIENGVMKGKVKNNSGLDLSNCAVITQSTYYNLGHMKIGEEKEIGSEINYMDPWSLVDGIIGQQRYFGSTPGMSQDEMRRFREIEQIRNIYRYYITTNYGGIKFMGIGSGHLEGDFRVNGGNVQKSEMILMTQDISVNFRNGNNIEYPYGFIQPGVGVSTFNYDGFMYYGKGEMEIVYSMDAGMKIEEIGIRAIMNKNNVISEIYNYKDNKWESINLDMDKTFKKDEAGKYISSNNTFKLRMKSGSTMDANFQIPLISVKGGVR